jgi:serine/threonine-protein kinase
MHEQGVVHRDLKPQNIMLCSDGTIRIMDFGIAKAAGRRMTFAGFTPAVGTPDYMAPEQVKGKRGDERTDIYSLGAMIYEMVVGVPPFQCENDNPLVIMNARVDGDPVALRKLNPKISPQVEEIVLHAMERDPGKRYQTAAAMKAELDDPSAVQLTGRCERLQEPSSGKRGLKKALWFALGISILLIIFGFVIWLIIHRGPAH